TPRSRRRPRSSPRPTPTATASKLSVPRTFTAFKKPAADGIPHFDSGESKMSLTAWRKARLTAPTVFLMLTCYLLALVSPRASRADDNDALAPTDGGTAGPADLTLPLPPPDSPEGMATVDLSTGAMRANYGFKLPRARGHAQPRVKLKYNSSE